jgi:hypothetical protein
MPIVGIVPSLKVFSKILKMSDVFPTLTFPTTQVFILIDILYFKFDSFSLKSDFIKSNYSENLIVL